MSTENNTMKIDDEKIKEVLRHHQDLTRQIHEQVIDIRKKIDEVKQQCLEIASYPKIDFNVESRGSGYYKDLTDVYLKYQKFIQTQAEQTLQTLEMQLHDAKLEVQKEFPKETELKEKNERLFELNALLNIDESNHMIIEEEQIEEEQEITEQTTQTTRKEYVPKFGTR